MKYLKIIPIATIAFTSYLLNLKNEPPTYTPIPLPTQPGAIGWDYDNNHYNYQKLENATVPSKATKLSIATSTKTIKQKKTRKLKKVHADSYYIRTK